MTISAGFPNRTCGRISALCAVFTAAALAADPTLTIYNQNFAVIRADPPARSEAGQQQRPFFRRDRAGGAGLGDSARPDRAAGCSGAGTKLPQRSHIAGAAAQPLRRQDHRFRGAQPGRHHRDRQRQNRAQRICAALPGDEPLRSRNMPPTRWAWRRAARGSRSSRWAESCNSCCRGSRFFRRWATTRFSSRRSIGSSTPRSRPGSTPN